MKTWLILAVGAVALYQVAKRYNLNSVDKLTKAVMPHVKGLVPKFQKIFAN